MHSRDKTFMRRRKKAAKQLDMACYSSFTSHELNWKNTLNTCIPVEVFSSHQLQFANYEQCRIKVGAIDAAALRPFKKQAHGHRREKEKSSLFC